LGLNPAPLALGENGRKVRNLKQFFPSNKFDAANGKKLAADVRYSLN